MTQTLWEIESDFIRLLGKMKATGVKIDRKFCKPKIIQGEEICRVIREQIGWNPGSPKQIGDFLLKDMGYPVVRRTQAGNPSFDKFALEEYEVMLEADGSDIAQKILRYRGWQKTVSSNYRPYLDLCDREAILHPNYKIHGTVTCRTSCEHPNLQQIPRESKKEWNGDLKKAFISRRPGYKLINFDAAQLEMRLTAAVAHEEELLEAFRTDEDVFDTMAARLGWERSDVKTFNYATLYGAGKKRIAMLFGLDLPVAEGMIDDFFGAYKGIKQVSKNAEALARNQGYIEYWTGRRRHLTDDYRKAFNAYVQGGAFEIVKRCLLRLQEFINSYPMVLTVHDSVVLEMPEEDCTPEILGNIKGVLEDVPESKEMGVPFKWEYSVWGED
jgi:DNA polymerase-1